MRKFRKFTDVTGALLSAQRIISREPSPEQEAEILAVVDEERKCCPNRDTIDALKEAEQDSSLERYDDFASLRKDDIG